MDQQVKAASRDSGDLRVEVIIEPDALAALKPDYDRLCAVTGNALPFTLFEWHETWCRHFLQRHAHIREQFLFFVVRDSTGICVAIFPLIYSRRRIGPFKSASVDLLGADPALTEIRGPLIEPGHEASALRLVRRELALLRDWDWDWVQWGTTNKTLLHALVTQAGVRPHLVTPDYLIDLPQNWETFRAGLKRNIRESLRHCYNSLKRAGHDFELKVVCNPADVRPALDRFLALHVMRANMQGTVAHPNRFASEISREFLYEVSEQLARRGVFRLFQLCIGAEVVAARIGFQVGDSLYLYYSGFDPDWAKYGVMTTTVAEAIKYAIGCGLKTVNLSPSADISKTRWGPRVVEHYTAYENRDRALSRVANKIYRYARAIDSSAPQIVRSLIKARREWE